MYWVSGLNDEPEDIMKTPRIRHDRCYHPNDKATRDACANQQREYETMMRELRMGRYGR